jgi:DMSO reductase iron-sulfur subunit
VTRPAFVFDANRCTGCQACELACVIENDLSLDAGWRKVHTFNERRLPGIPLFHLSLACNHCAQPSCMDACPALAYSRDAETGAVLIDAGKCIGCGYCSWACPYDAPRYDAARGVMTKCTFCNDRLHRGEPPACVSSCPTDALGFERLAAEQMTHDVPGFEPTALEPSIRIVRLRKGATAPAPAPGTQVTLPPTVVPPKVALRKEWSLAAFTFLAAFLFALFAATLPAFVPAGGPLDVDPVKAALVFVVLSAAAMAIGTLHLGRKERAWRAVLGLSRSWLSREIVFFSGFVVSAALALLAAPESPAVGAVPLFLGLAALLSMDRVYRFAIRRRPLPHSASVLLTGAFLAALLLDRVPFAVGLGILKVVLYAGRELAFARRDPGPRPFVSALRVVLTLVALSWFFIPLLPWVVCVACALAAELVDRCEFYAELEFPTPERRLRLDSCGNEGP